MAFGAGEEAGVDGLAGGEISFRPMHLKVVNQLHMLLQRYRHKSDAICVVRVITPDLFVFFVEPLDLVSSDAIEASHAHAVCFTGAEEPDASCYLFGRVL